MSTMRQPNPGRLAMADLTIPRWLRALTLAKILFEDEGYHTRYLEEIEEYIKKGGEAMIPQSTRAPSPQQLDLLRRLFSNDKDVRDAALEEWAPQPGPLFSSPDQLSTALKTLAIERINLKKGGHQNGQQLKSTHQARAASGRHHRQRLW